MSGGRPPDRWLDHPTRWRRPDWAVLLGLSLAMFALYARLWAPGPWRRWFPDGDFTDQFLAFARFEVLEFARGRLPLWNPFAFGGSPFWADVQAAVAYPPSLANSLGHAALLGRMTLAGLQAEAVAHLALAAVFTYAFARAELGSRAAAAIAATTFAFGGFLAGYPPLQLAVLETAVWLPVVLLGLKWLAASRLAGGAALFAAGVACTITAGHPQTALYTAYLAAAYALYVARPWRPLPRRFLGWTALGLGLGLAASAAGWLPALEFQRLSNRVRLPYEDMAHGFPPSELLGVLTAGLTQWAPLYVGMLSLVLAVLAIAAWGVAPVRPVRTGLWLGAGVAALLVSLGGAGPVYDILFNLAPGWGLFRGQERAAFVFSFSLAMLAGTGAVVWRTDPRARRWVLAVTPALAGLLVVVVAAGPRAAEQNALAALLVVLAVAGLAALETPERAMRTGTWLTLVLALIVVDLALAVGRSNLRARPPTYPAASPLVATMRENPGGRIANHDRLPRNFGVMHGLEALSGSSPLRLAAWDELQEALGANEPRMWQMLGVNQVLTWREELDVPFVELLEIESDGTTSAAATGTSRVMALREPGPLAWRVSEARVLEHEAAKVRVAAPDFDPMAEVLLETGSAGSDPGGTAFLQETGREPGRASVLTDGDAPAWIVFSEMHYPGWGATVDGVPTELHRADVALMAVRVPAGRHEVSLEFRPRIVYFSIVLSMLGWIGIAILGARAMGIRTRPAEPLSD